MSYRDLRNLSEILRTVGYPRLVSIENFRNPNFPLVADIGLWLVNQYEPKAEFPTAIEKEQDRVVFIRTFAEFMVTKVHISLNTKRLYQADGYAVKELIKVASVLHTAMKEAEKIVPGVVKNLRSKNVNFDITSKMDELKKTRALASEITQRGVALYDMLNKEVALREARNAAVSKAYEHEEVERLLNAAVQSAAKEVAKLQSMVDSVKGNLSSLDAKIEKRKLELERSQKRLQTLKKVRPAFMDEYERMQVELAEVYKEYVNRYRCLSYLQNQMEEMNRLDIERKAEERLNKSELANGEDILYNSKGDNAYSGTEESSDEDEPVQLSMNTRDFMNSRASKNNTAGGRPQATANSMRSNPQGLGSHRTALSRGRQLYGSMLGGADDSGESESDLIMVDGDNSELGSDEPDDEEEDLLLQQTALRMARSMGVPSSMQDHIVRAEMKHAASLMNGNGLDTPPVPSVSAAGSAINIPQNYGAASSSTSNSSIGMPMPNGGIKNEMATTNGVGPAGLPNGGHGYSSNGTKSKSRQGTNQNGSTKPSARPTTNGKKYPPPEDLDF